METASNTAIGILLLMLLISVDINAKPWPQRIHPKHDITTLDPSKAVCTTETASLCQKCAKETKSDVVYPWCCTNHEGARTWCENYLYFGLQ
ncbi:uncharacterized protein LOC107269798 [Cephus cinctus]|uniref:Uncharacterized protein LOC107269798 n=1 Tax=Cephus cinctus TaxID=211228 RepID=A0AAJ7C2B7_CEPCN|nr:uncharacterized protein LOC107269798 [Cephus cinctus]